MSAPDVRMETQYVGVCRYCHYYRTVHYGTDLDAEAELRRHELTCPALTLRRLQARWDARDTALRALVTEWRTESERVEREHKGGGPCELATGYRFAANELEQAIGGSRG